MNTRNYSTPTKKYKALASAIHSVYRLIDSTFELKDLVARLARLTCQIFNAKYCIVVLLDNTKLKVPPVKVFLHEGRERDLVEGKGRGKG